MKKLIFILTLASITFFSFGTKAQVNISVNIGNQPVWGPTGYDYVEYYYLPDIDMYYNVPNRQFVYMDMGQWIFSANLPMRYRNYNLYNGYKVVVNRPDAYRYYNQDRVRYSNYRNWSGQRQVIIRDRPTYRTSPSYRNDTRVVVNRERNYNYSARNNYNNSYRGNQSWNRGDNGNRGSENRGNDRNENRGNGNENRGNGNKVREYRTSENRGNNGNGNGNGKHENNGNGKRERG